ncbi:MAG: hypothetical protein KDK25_07470 [Leptospiraceae bacterium]|nr:hypothetical protein [Leptospiraceae bacterium]
MDTVKRLSHRILERGSFKPAGDTLAALRRALWDYPELLALTCFWLRPDSTADECRAQFPESPDGIPLMKQRSSTPLALVFYASRFIPASRLRHLGLYVRRLFPVFGLNPVLPAVSSASPQTLLARFYGFIPVEGNPHRSIATLHASLPEQEHRWAS